MKFTQVVYIQFIFLTNDLFEYMTISFLLQFHGYEGKESSFWVLHELSKQTHTPNNLWLTAQNTTQRHPILIMTWNNQNIST